MWTNFKVKFRFNVNICDKYKIKPIFKFRGKNIFEIFNICVHKFEHNFAQEATINGLHNHDNYLSCTAFPPWFACFDGCNYIVVNICSR